MSRSQTSYFDEIEYVFLDRDGVINQSPGEARFVTTVEQFHLLPGVIEPIAALNHSGRKVIVTTNQRGVALGLLSLEDLDRIHQHMRHGIEKRGARIDAVYYCPHDKGQCDCRKPLPGLFHQAFRAFPGAAPGNGVMIGDSLCDIEAGRNIGMKTIFICPDAECMNRDAVRAATLADATAPSLKVAVEKYLSIRLLRSRH